MERNYSRLQEETITHLWQNFERSQDPFNRNSREYFPDSPDQGYEYIITSGLQGWGVGRRAGGSPGARAIVGQAEGVRLVAAEGEDDLVRPLGLHFPEV